MYAYHKQLHSATAVDHAVYCSFVSSKRKCVVIFCGTRMAVYFVRETKLSDGKQTAKLDFFYATTLFGLPVSVAVVPKAAENRDGLFVAFREAKTVLLTFDIEQHDVRTSWIHNFEDDIRRAAHFEPLLSSALPIVTVEPQRRICALVSYGRYLSVVNVSPFGTDSKPDKSHGDTTTGQVHSLNDKSHGDKQSGRGGVGPCTVRRLFDVDLRAVVSNSLRRVIDATFLFGYYEATLCILYECAPRGADGTARCELAALSISVSFPTTLSGNAVLATGLTAATVTTATGVTTGVLNALSALNSSQATPIWRLDSIPNDSLSLIAVPAPLGGVLVAAANQLMYARQSARSHYVALNSLAFGTAEFPVRNASPLPVRIALDGARFRFLTSFQCLISLRNGELFVLSLLTDSTQPKTAGAAATPTTIDLNTAEFDGTLAVRAFYFERCAAAVFASCVCLVSNDLLLIGSRVANSLLLRFTAKQPIAADLIDKYLTYYAPATKQSQTVTAMQQFVNDCDADDAFLYETTVGKRPRTDSSNEMEADGDEQRPLTVESLANVPLFTFAFALCDSLLNVAPCRAAALGETVTLSDSLAAEATRIEWNGEAVTSEESLELALACGAGKNGAIALLQRGVRPCVASTFPLDACRDVFTAYDDAEITRRNAASQTNQSQTPKNQPQPEARDEVKQEPATQQDAAPEESANAVSENEVVPDLFHRYVLISRNKSTMVLEAGNDIAEVETAFCTQDETVATGHIRFADRCFTLQVCRRVGLFLVSNGNQLVQSANRSVFSAADQVEGEMADENESHWLILSAYILDECCVVLTNRNVAYLVTLSADNEALPKLLVRRLFDKVSCVSLYRDSTGLMRTYSAPTMVAGPIDVNSRSEQPQQISKHSDTKQTQLAEEDAFLYNVDDVQTQQTTEAALSEELELSGQSELYWIVVVRAGGSLELFGYSHVTNTPSLSLDVEVSLHYACNRFASLFPVIAANDLLRAESESHAHSQLGEKLEDERSCATEVLLTDLEALEPRRPFLLVRTAEFLHIYEAFSIIGSKLDYCSSYSGAAGVAQRRFTRNDSFTLARLDSYPNGAREVLSVQFRRVEALMFVRGKKESAAEKRKRLEVEAAEGIESSEVARAQLKVFRNVSGHSGVFVSGALPYFVLLSPKGALRVLPMDIDGPVLSFAEFNNVNCPLGFLYFNKRCELRISMLPSHLNYESEWLVRKIPLKSTPHFLNYHLDSKTWVLVTSASVPCTRTWKVNPEGEKECEIYERDDRFIFPTIEQFRLELRAPDSFEPVSSAGVEFDECENVTAMKVVNVRSQETVTRFKAVVALGTNYCYGEDVINRGRLFIVDIIEVVPEPGKPLTNKKLKIIHNELQKGPVTAIAGLNGNIVTAIGQKVYIWELKEDHTLDALAFIDTQLYTVSMSTLKNFILIGDIAKGISVLRYQDEWRVLSFVSRELRQCEVYAVEFFVDQKNLGFMMTDHLQNVLCYSYDPESRDSYGGLRLVRKADFNLASHVCNMLRIKSKLSADFLERKTIVQNEKRHILFSATLDGSLHVLQPIPEKVYRRLNMLHSLLTVHIQHRAGCNPRGFRSVANSSVQLTTPQHNIVDGELVSQFFTMLNRAEQVDLAKRIGTTSEQLYDDIYDLDRLASHF